MKRARTPAALIAALVFATSACSSATTDFMLDVDEMVSGRDKLATATVQLGVATHSPPGTGDTRVARAGYRDEAVVDLYFPPDFTFAAALPTVVVVNGFAAVGATELVRPDGGIETLPAVDMQAADAFISLANAIAASGLIAVVYGTTDDPTRDLDDVMAWLLDNAGELRIDTDHLALWMFSAHTLVGLRAAMDDGRRWARSLSSVVVFYGWMPLDTLRPDLPVLAVKALGDLPMFTESMDDFMAAATEAGVSVEYLEVDAPHSFDFDPGFATAADPVVERALEFIRDS